MRNCTAKAFEHHSHAAKHVHFCLANIFETSLETRQSSPAIIAGTGMFQCDSVPVVIKMQIMCMLVAALELPPQCWLKNSVSYFMALDYIILIQMQTIYTSIQQYGLHSRARKEATHVHSSAMSGKVMILPSATAIMIQSVIIHFSAAFNIRIHSG